jgi:hypothetical protein
MPEYTDADYDFLQSLEDDVYVFETDGDDIDKQELIQYIVSLTEATRRLQVWVDYKLSGERSTNPYE